jgi:hypothetical protein
VLGAAKSVAAEIAIEFGYIGPDALVLFCQVTVCQLARQRWSGSAAAAYEICAL